MKINVCVSEGKIAALDFFFLTSLVKSYRNVIFYPHWA